MISPSVTRCEQQRFDWETGAGGADTVRRVVERAAAADGRDPLNEAAILALRHHGLEGATMWCAEGGFVLVHASLGAAGEVEADLVVDPEHRGRGVGHALATTALAGFPDSRVLAWSHGNHPAAATLATTLGFEQVRDLWLMRRPLDEPLPPLPDVPGVVVRAFDADRDADAVLDVNAQAFHDHPEQGSLSRADLERRMAEPWFDPAGFFVAESKETGAVLGFHWTKTHDEEPPLGEVYVVGISPEAQGMGLGKVLTLRGLHHLAERGLPQVVLFVEADNAPAIAVYRKLGFGHAAADTDVMYARGPATQQPS